ncbi:TonB-dependent receptor [Chitinophaga tropicalis]|nr:TonB-dependent receptor [Chitinophaga tropicalis]
MKLATVLLIFTMLQARATGFAQQITLSEHQTSLREIFRKIKKQTGFNFLYNPQMLKEAGNVTLEVKSASLEEVMDKCLAGRSLTYAVTGNIVIIKKKITALVQQQLTIGGQVTNNKGQPMPGVSVRVKGTATGASTGADGRYRLQVPDNNVILVFSFIGHATKEVPVNGQSVINVQLTEGSTALNTLVVVSYGIQRKRDIVGAIDGVQAPEIRDMPVGTFAEKLQGKMPGMQMAQASGRPGQGMDLRIRGAASIGGSNKPLVVIDGIPMLGVNDAINNVNPDEIETFSLLKDASATALYGSRGANGVVIITTKRGKAGKSRIDFNAYYGVATMMKELKPDVMNGTELATYMKGFYEDKARYENYTGGIPAAYQNPEEYGEGTDWYSLLMRDAPVQSYSLSFSTGNERSTLSVIGGYFNQQGIMKNSGYKRYSLRINADMNLNDHIRIGANLAPSLQLEHNNRQGTNFNVDGQRAILASALMIPSMGSPYNTDGSLALGIQGFPGMFSWANPLRQLLETNDDATRTRLLGNIYTEIKFLKDFSFNTSFNYDIGLFARKKFVPSTAVGGFNNVPIANAPPGDKSAYGESNFNYSYNWTNENILNWQHTFNGKHAVKVLLGQSTQQFSDYRNNLTGRDFPDNSVEYLNAATRFTLSNSTSEGWALVSYFARLNYDFKGKYLLQASLRRDGSSRFGINNRWGTFPAVGVGWIVSEEPFMKGLTWLSYGKIRSSYGLTGSNELDGNYTAIPLVGSNNYVFGSTLAPGKVQTTLGNNLLSWEKSAQLDIGIDAGLFNDRVTISYDYYHKLTQGLLYPVAVPRASGYSTVQDNVGDIKFWGHELTINTRNLTGNFKWNTGFNIAFNRNKVTRLGINNAPIADKPSTTITDFTDWRTQVGMPLGLFYGYVFDGVYMNQAEFDKGPKYYNASGVLMSDVGTVRMKDVNGDGKVTPDDKTFIGNPNPDFIFGFTNNFSYREFDLGITMSGTYGNDLKNGMDESLYNLDGAFNGPKELLQRWRSEDDPGNGRIQRTKAGSTMLARSDNSYFIYNASHLTINNITLGYTFRKIKNVQSFRIYGSVQNAYIFTSYPGNPEVSSSGLNGVSQGQDLGAYPVPRTYVVGLNLSL